MILLFSWFVDVLKLVLIKSVHVEDYTMYQAVMQPSPLYHNDAMNTVYRMIWSTFSFLPLLSSTLLGSKNMPMLWGKGPVGIGGNTTRAGFGGYNL